VAITHNNLVGIMLPNLVGIMLPNLVAITHNNLVGIMLPSLVVERRHSMFRTSRHFKIETNQRGLIQICCLLLVSLALFVHVGSKVAGFRIHRISRTRTNYCSIKIRTLSQTMGSLACRCWCYVVYCGSKNLLGMRLENEQPHPLVFRMMVGR
jgi:hypothetical protein